MTAGELLVTLVAAIVVKLAANYAEHAIIRRGIRARETIIRTAQAEIAAMYERSGHEVYIRPLSLTEHDTAKTGIVVRYPGCEWRELE